MKSVQGAGRFPFTSFPMGWFAVATSAEVVEFDVVPLKYFGRELVAWRAETGEAHVMDAFCPHLGAHLGYRGTVSGRTITCPFHHWEFDGDGNCVEIPYSKRQPGRQAVIPSYPVVEQNGLIFAWYHPTGASPWFSIPEVPEWQDSRYSSVLVEERRQVRTVWQEIAENVADTAHAFYVHSDQPVRNFEVHEESAHRRVRLLQKATTPYGEVDTQVESEAYGPGFGVTRFRSLVEGCMISSITPLNEECVDVRFFWLMRNLDRPEITRRVCDLIAERTMEIFEEDVVIWEHKAYREHPPLVPEDGPILRFRRWAKQFQPDG
jgi:3-ketosteroid 9alpha-monooxygenase subunit A